MFCNRITYLQDENQLSWISKWKSMLQLKSCEPPLSNAMVQTEALVAQAKIGARMPLLFLIKHISSSSASFIPYGWVLMEWISRQIQSLCFVFKLPIVLCSQRQTRALGLEVSSGGWWSAWWAPHTSAIMLYVSLFLHPHCCIFPISAFWINEVLPKGISSPRDWESTSGEICPWL